MLALRTALFLLFQTVTVVPWGLCCLLIAPLPLHLRYRFTIGWTKMVLWAARVICGIEWEVRGRENFPDGPAIILSKHQSTWETFVMPAIMPHPLAYVFKKELLHVPFFGWAMGRLDMIHIDRKQRSRAFAKVVQQGRRLMEEGVWVIMFPEGTRIPRGERASTKAAVRVWPLRPVCR